MDCVGGSKVAKFANAFRFEFIIHPLPKISFSSALRWHSSCSRPVSTLASSCRAKRSQSQGKKWREVFKCIFWHFEQQGRKDVRSEYDELQLTSKRFAMRRVNAR